MIETSNSYTLHIILFFILCAALCSGVWYGLHTLESYREEYDFIVNERDNFSSIMDGLRNKNKTLKNINRLNSNFNEVGTALDGVEFYSHVRNLIETNAINMLSMSTNDNNILTLKLQGNYYSFVHLLADWRTMPFASRVTSLRIARDAQNPDDFIEADVTLEAWLNK